jgi:MFS family permease
MREELLKSRSPSTQAGATPRAKLATLGVFFCINLLNYMDRYAVTGVLPLLLRAKTSGFDADISKTQGATLTTAFIVVYMCVSPVFGYLADRVESRKLLVLVGLILWALASGASSVAPNYTWLLILRAAVGVGEASYATVAPVVISDMYPPEERTAKLAVFYMAIPVGLAAGYMIGGQVGDMLGWRWALRVAPALLIVLAVTAVPFVYEPARGQSDSGAVAAAPQKGGAGGGLYGWFVDVRAVLSVRSFALATAGAAASNFGGAAVGPGCVVFCATVLTGVQASAGATKVVLRGNKRPDRSFSMKRSERWLCGCLSSSCRLRVATTPSTRRGDFRRSSTSVRRALKYHCRLSIVPLSAARVLPVWAPLCPSTC